MDVAFDVYDNFYCDGWTNVEWSTTGGSTIADWAAGGTDASGHLVDSNDLVYVLDAPGDVFSGGIGCPTTLVARGITGAAVAPVQGSTFGGDAAGHAAMDTGTATFTIPSLAAGATADISILTRYYHFAYGATEADTKANAFVQSTAAINAAENEDFYAFAVAGVPVPATVANWTAVAVAPPAAPTIAATGSTVNPWAGTAALGAILLGALMVIATRQRPARRH